MTNRKLIFNGKSTKLAFPFLSRYFSHNIIDFQLHCITWLTCLSVNLLTLYFAITPSFFVSITIFANIRHANVSLHCHSLPFLPHSVCAFARLHHIVRSREALAYSHLIFRANSKFPIVEVWIGYLFYGKDMRNFDFSWESLIIFREFSLIHNSQISIPFRLYLKSKYQTSRNTTFRVKIF